MENLNDPKLPQEEQWEDVFLAAQEPEAELGPDEHALSAAGLTSPEDLELERIFQEAREDSFASPETSDPTLIQDTQFFVPQEMPPMTTQPTMEPAPQVEAPSDEEEDISPAPQRKRRPERKKGEGLLGIPHMLATVIWLGIIVAIGVSLGRLVWVAASDMLAFNKPFVSATITISAEDSLDDVVAQLEDAGLVRYPVLFKVFAQMKGGREEISNGTFTFTNDKLYDYNAVMNNMNPYSSGREEIKDLLIPEGYTCAQIFALLEEKGVCAAAELEEYCANGNIKDYWFLEGVERGDKYCLEGYLFPDTYNFYKDDSPAHVIGKMLDGFDSRYTDVMKDKLEPLNQRMAKALADRGFDQAYIDAHKLTIREVVIIASMIERESTGGSERFKVSAVIFNRLTNPKNFPKLQIDATILYALGGNLDENGKVKPLTKADLAMDHPYNSYVYDGLIPGPISNPGTDSLNAALDPDENGYYFYVYDPDAGEHIFSKTVEEHERAIASINRD